MEKIIHKVVLAFGWFVTKVWTFGFCVKDGIKHGIQSYKRCTNEVARRFYVIRFYEGIQEQHERQP